MTNRVNVNGVVSSEYLYRGCSITEDRLKRATDFLVETRRQLVSSRNDRFWLDKYREADGEVRKWCAAYLATPAPRPPEDSR